MGMLTNKAALKPESLIYLAGNCLVSAVPGLPAHLSIEFRPTVVFHDVRASLVSP